MASVRETVLAAFKTQLATALAAAPAISVFRNRKDAITSAPAVVIEDGGMAPDTSNIAEDRYRMRVRVWAYVEAGASEDGEDVGGDISELHGRIVKAITSDRSLGGVAEDVEPLDMDDPEWDLETGTRDNAAFAVGFTVEFTTKAGDPTVVPA